MTLVIVTQEDDSKFKTEVELLNVQIQEATTTITKAEAQLASKYHNLVENLTRLDTEIAKLATVTPQEAHKPTEDVDAKTLFRKIAKLTHPDKIDNIDLFIKAKQALRRGDQEALKDILAEAQSSWADLLIKKRLAYQDLLQSVPYLMAMDWFSNDFMRQTRVETHFLQNLINVMQMKQNMLDAMLTNKL